MTIDRPTLFNRFAGALLAGARRAWPDREREPLSDDTRAAISEVVEAIADQGDQDADRAVEEISGIVSLVEPAAWLVARKRQLLGGPLVVDREFVACVSDSIEAASTGPTRWCLALPDLRAGDHDETLPWTYTITARLGENRECGAAGSKATMLREIKALLR